MTRSYERALRKDLDDLGWTSSAAVRVAGIVSDSLAVEAKIGDLKRALQQVSRFRRGFHRSAIVMPTRRISEELSRSLDFYGTGLLTQGPEGFEWQRVPNEVEPAIYSRLWLLELVMRGVENGTAYRLSALRNRSSA